ncbi:MAG: hypothetical protein ACI84K_000042 [Pseudohongiellaceae bacterium]|jgi:hypothetical protein
MVDLRPLLFINFLFLLLLITAGFTSVSPLSQGLQNSPSEPLVTENKIHDQPELNNPESQKNPNKTSATTGAKNTSPKLLSQSETDKTSVESDAIFADEYDSNFKDFTSIQAPFESLPDKPRNEARDAEEIVKAEQPEVVAYTNAPKKAPIATGKLIIKSNVYDDTVLVNGKPYGPTMLELDLTPGSYMIEVAKNGYNSWSTQVDVRRGTSKSLNARLEHYTKVEYINGSWTNDIVTGEGRYSEDGKLEYNGSFVNGDFHGSGSVRYANGMKYQGEWFEGKMQGQGSLTTTDGDTYIGDLDENKFNGEGTLTKATGDIYSGFWIDGVLNGQGSLTTKGGLLYVGGFADNLFHGNGSLTYPDGGHYEGSFSNGMFHGKGFETYANGKKYVGQFIDGLYHGKGEILNPNGSKITGTFKDGDPFGKATLTTAEGEIFTARSSDPGVCYRLKSYRATECPQLDGW